MVLFFDVKLTSITWQQYQASHFPTVTGTIVHSNVKTEKSDRHNRTYYSTADVVYRYTVGSQNFTNTTIRFGMGVSGRAYAQKNVSKLPVGLDVTVYYDPQDPAVAMIDPGLQGSDLFAVVFLTPFNAIMVLFWMGMGSTLRQTFFRPVAGGVKLITEGTTIRVRMPEGAPFGWGIGAAGALGVVFILAVGGPTNMQPSMPLVLATIGVVYGTGIGVWLWKWRIVSTGVDDLVIDKFNRKVTLPETCGRNTLLTVAVPDIQAIWVEKITHISSKGGRSYTYAPTFYIPKTEKTFEKLADWSNQRKADDFAQWLSKQINVPIEATQPTQRFAQST